VHRGVSTRKPLKVDLVQSSAVSLWTVIWYFLNTAYDSLYDNKMLDINFTCQQQIKTSHDDNWRAVCTSVSGESTRNRVYWRSVGLLGGSWCTVVWYLWYTLCDTENVSSNSWLGGCDRTSRSYTTSDKHILQITYTNHTHHFITVSFCLKSFYLQCP